MSTNRPTNLKTLPGRTREEQKQAAAAIAAETGEAMEEALIGKELVDSSRSLHTVGGFVVSEEISWKVDCDLPMYMGYSVYFRTNNPTEVILNRPRLQYSNEFHALDERMNTMLSEAASKGERNLPVEYQELAIERDAMRLVEYDAFLEKEARWLSRFVKRIEPWNFGHAVEWDENGTVTRAEGYPALNSSKPETYLVLLREHEALGKWCEDVGYTKALEVAARPFSRGSGRAS